MPTPDDVKAVLKKLKELSDAGSHNWGYEYDRATLAKTRVVCQEDLSAIGGVIRLEDVPSHSIRAVTTPTVSDEMRRRAQQVVASARAAGVAAAKLWANRNTDWRGSFGFATVVMDVPDTSAGQALVEIGEASPIGGLCLLLARRDSWCELDRSAGPRAGRRRSGLRSAKSDLSGCDVLGSHSSRLGRGGVRFEAGVRRNRQRPGVRARSDSPHSWGSRSAGGLAVSAKPPGGASRGDSKALGIEVSGRWDVLHVLASSGGPSSACERRMYQASLSPLGSFREPNRGVPRVKVRNRRRTVPTRVADYSVGLAVFGTADSTAWCFGRYKCFSSS